MKILFVAQTGLHWNETIVLSFFCFVLFCFYHYFHILRDVCFTKSYKSLQGLKESASIVYSTSRCTGRFDRQEVNIITFNVFPFPFRVVWSRSDQKCSIQSRWNMVLCLICLLKDQPFSVLLFSQEDTYMWHILRWMILLPSILKLSRMLMIRFYLTFFFFNVAILCNLFGLGCLLQISSKMHVPFSSCSNKIFVSSNLPNKSFSWIIVGFTAR